MDKVLIIEKTKEYVKETLKDDSSGHDWWHIFRVCELAKEIAKQENAEVFAVELGALLHDTADYKFYKGDLEEGVKVQEKRLREMGVDEKTIEIVGDIIANTSFKGAKVKVERKFKEGQIVSDADKIDAIGAIGIARVFAYGGSKGHLIYDPQIKPVVHQSFEDYKIAHSPSINHFYEKLLLLKDQMYTETGKKIAQHRHKYMEEFLKEFYYEWDGKL